MLNHPSWFWIAIMLTVPPVAGVLLAMVCWRKHEMILGNVAGTIVIFGTAMALIFREAAELDVLARQCLDAGFICWPYPSAFMRYAIYAVIGLVEVVTLFLASLRVERRMRRGGYAPEWQR